MKTTVIVPVDAPLMEQVRASAEDIGRTWAERRMWALWAIRSVGNRYKRTVLGPWWLTLTTLLFVFGLALLRVGLGGGDLREAIPYVGLGYIIFGLISGGVLAGVGVYTSAGTELSTARNPYSMYVARSNLVQVIDFLHDAVVILVLVLVFAIPFSLAWGWSVVATVLIVASSVGVGLWLGPVASRFRDIGPLVQAIMRLMFFLTPIFWSVDQIQSTGRANWAWYNPFTYPVLAFRDPILGTDHGWAPLVVTAGLAVLNLVVGVIVFTRFRARIPYWVAS